MKPTKDKELIARNSIGAALITGLFSQTKWGKQFGIDPALATTFGLILGPIVDHYIFTFKTWLKARKVEK